MKRWCVLLLAISMLMGSMAFASNKASGMGVVDCYEAGADLFCMEDYEQAAEYFEAAGNYKDAKKWAYYCQAISIVLNSNGRNTKMLNSAQVRFEVLAAQSFEDATDWVQYCKARAFEAESMLQRAKELYATIVVHDSVERYLACLNRAGVLESTTSVRARMTHQASRTVREMYDAGMDLFYLEDYRKAADFFCMAGNYQDARKWRCFCQAAALVVENVNMEDAQVLFELLVSQGFEMAQDWQVYCKARSYESALLVPKAIELYKSVFVFDSSERYLRLSGF